jgi:hypothetical protein
MTPVIDAIEGRGWRQEIRHEMLCKLQQKLWHYALTRRGRVRKLLATER